MAYAAVLSLDLISPLSQVRTRRGTYGVHITLRCAFYRAFGIRQLPLAKA